MKNKISGIFYLIFAIITAVYVQRIIVSDGALLANILFLVPPAIAVLAGAYAAKAYGLANPHGRAIAYLTAGLGCLFIGETIFFGYQFIWDIDPFPSIADIFYIVAYPLLFIGLVNELKTYKINWHDWRGSNKLAITLISLLLAIIGFIVAYFGIYLAYEPGDPLLNNVIALGYGVVDLILLVPALFILRMVLDFRGGKLFYSWLLVLLAILCIMIGDILFAIFTDQYEKLIPEYGLIDLSWTAGYLLFAGAFAYTKQTIDQLQSKLKSSKKT